MAKLRMVYYPVWIDEKGQEVINPDPKDIEEYMKELNEPQYHTMTADELPGPFMAPL